MQKVCKKAENIDKILSIKVNNALPDAIKKSYTFDIFIKLHCCRAIQESENSQKASVFMFLHRTEAPRRLHSGETLVLRFRKLNQKLLLMVVDGRYQP